MDELKSNVPRLVNISKTVDQPVNTAVARHVCERENLIIGDGLCCCLLNELVFTLSVPVVLLNCPNLSPYFSLYKFKRALLLILSSLVCLINYHFLITKYLILYVLCREKLGVDNCLGLKGFMPSFGQ